VALWLCPFTFPPFLGVLCDNIFTGGNLPGDIILRGIFSADTAVTTSLFDCMRGARSYTDASEVIELRTVVSEDPLAADVMNIPSGKSGTDERETRAGEVMMVGEELYLYGCGAFIVVGAFVRIVPTICVQRHVRRFFHVCNSS